jgi:hypothetical protein
MGGPKANVIDAKLKDLIVHMKHHVSKIFIPFMHILHGFDQKRP